VAVNNFFASSHAPKEVCSQPHALIKYKVEERSGVKMGKRKWGLVGRPDPTINYKSQKVFLVDLKRAAAGKTAKAS